MRSSCWRPGDETQPYRPAPHLPPPILAPSLIYQAGHDLLLASFFPSVIEEIEVVCVQGSHSDSEMWNFHFCSPWHWIQMTKIDVGLSKNCL